MNSRSNQKTVFVGLSGGVDSSVSAYLLKKAGYKVVGVFIKTWQPDFIECTWKDERRDAMRVAAHLEIPFITIDLEKEYKEGVADYMIAEYKAGRTPNPDVMCNKEVKFGGFLKYALSKGADFVATGHYARVIDYRFLRDSKKTIFKLFKAKDQSKEQSYFLWTLTEDQLSHILFPIGHLEKKEVRSIAKKAGLLTASKKDSQGVCFIGKFDFKDFLKHYIEPKRGDVLNENGEVIGYHDGVTFLTLGERSGFTITKKGTDDSPMYVIAKDIEKNTITVSSNPSPHTLAHSHTLPLTSTNWIVTPETIKTYQAQVRYHGELLSCRIINISTNESQIEFEEPVLVASGQSIVVYDGDICVGGGIVK